ncbi:MAG: serine hydrolase domain-containing protein [Pseudomonadota bacterium]
MTEQIEVMGNVAPGFETVTEAYRANFSRGDVYEELGSSLCVYHEGKRVVDIWAGFQDRERTRPWEADTTICVYSTTKALTALCLALLVDRGQIQYDDLVSKYWPEYGTAGKEPTTIAHFLSHQSGCPAIREKTEMDEFMNFDLICRRLAAQEPYWVPGENTAYHGSTYGFLTGEIVRRVTGMDIGQFLQEEIAGPLGAEAYIGLPEEKDSAAAILYGPKIAHEMPDTDELPQFLIDAATNPALDPEAPNRREWRASILPALCGYASAQGLASIFVKLAEGGSHDGTTLLSADTLNQMTRVISDRVDGLLGQPVDWAHGVVNNNLGLYGPNAKTFGHSGWGGSFVCADRENRVSIGFVCNQMGPDPIGDARTLPVIDAIYKNIV